MNGKGDKYRVKWSKDFEVNYNNIFNKGDKNARKKDEKICKKEN
jgi:hypothetical protein|tara:strand:+ start:464 stop:595 length:132 start_codon:yes stop_codon:yes gene_type:complete